MTHPIIKTEKMRLQLTYTKNEDGTEYLLCNEKDNFYHLPLNNAPTLEGVPLLPPLEDEVDSWITNTIGNLKDEHTKKTAAISLKGGYNKAKEKYKYTEEDLRKCWKACLDFNKPAGSDSGINLEDFIQSFQQPKYPVAFDCEMVTPYTDGYADDRVRRFYGVPEAKTITNSQGLTQIVGKYIY